MTGIYIQKDKAGKVDGAMEYWKLLSAAMVGR